MTAPLTIVGLTELADLLGQNRDTVRQWYHRGKLPPADCVLAAGPVWRVSTIERWRR
jgi:predicted site-specific integrase-resolvase